MSRDHILAIDNGTQSVRALLFDPNGNLLAKARAPFEPYFTSRPGYAEQDPEVFWQAVCTACQHLWKMPAVSKEAVCGVALTTQRGTVIKLDQDGKPLRPAIDAAVGLGLHPDFETAVKEMARPGAAFEPRAQAHAIYDELFRNVYEKMYRRLKPLYKAIRNAARKV